MGSVNKKENLLVIKDFARDTTSKVVDIISIISDEKLDKCRKINIPKKVTQINILQMRRYILDAIKLEEISKNLSENVSYERSDVANELMLYVEETKKNCEKIISSLKGYDAEVLALIERKQKGESDFPPYDGKIHGNPLNYLGKYFKKYLRYFGSHDDFLYQDQLAKIMGGNFVEALRKHINRYENFDMNYVVPKKSTRMNKNANLVTPQELEKSKEIHSLYVITKRKRKNGGNV